MADKRPKLPAARPPARPSGPRAGVLTTVVVIAVILVGAFIWYQMPGRSAAPPPALPNTTDMSLGPADAPVTLEEFADFQCPSCKAANQSIVRRLQADAVAPGSKFRLVYRNFPFIGTESQLLAEGGVCAADQGKFVPYEETLFAQQRPERSGYWTKDRLGAVAGGLGLDQGKFAACLDAGQARTLVAQDYDRGRGLGVRGTPTFAVNGKLVSPDRVPSYEELKQAIEQAAAAAASK